MTRYSRRPQILLGMPALFLVLLALGVPVARAQAPAAFSFDEVASYPFPNALAASAKADRIAWVFNERGLRNVWVAEGPEFAPRQLTRYQDDDGQELTSLSLSADGRWVLFVRGGDHGSNWDDDVPVNVVGTPTLPQVLIWAVPFEGGEPRSIGDGDFPVISPKGDVVAFEKGGHVWLAPIDGSQPAKRAIAVRGNNGSVAWSPDGSRIAFVCDRGDHAFIGIYAGEQASLVWLVPSTSRDSSPRWSPDGTRVAFVRRPGAGGAPEPILEARHRPWAIWTADASTGEGAAIWTAPTTLRGSVPTTEGGTNLHWAARGRIAFLSYADGWPHLYSVPEKGGEALLLTPGAFMAEYIRLSPDRTTLVFAANAGNTPGDIDRRHVARVPVDRAAMEVLTPGTGLEWTPVMTGGTGRLVFISATAQRPPLPTVMSADGKRSILLAENRIPAGFPTRRLVTPKQVTFKASDGLLVHAQLFEPPAVSDRRPAIVYVHGGPPRQMLLGWHYSDYYARAYAMNQYLASRGYVVLSVNYRLGIGYGYEFHRPPAAGAQGASEYLDVKAGAEYLRALPNVDGQRIGIYGGSYGGFLTALALGRNSDLFAAGVDIHGVHDFTAPSGSGSGQALAGALAGGKSFEPNDREKAAEVAWQSSPVSSVSTWKSPVLLIHGDDDRNVRFSQTVDLARRLSAAAVSYEELVIPDDTHHWMRFSNAVRVHEATLQFFDRVLAKR